MELVPRVRWQFPVRPLRHGFAGGPQPRQASSEFWCDEEFDEFAWGIVGSPEADDDDAVGGQPADGCVVGGWMGQIVVALGQRSLADGQDM